MADAFGGSIVLQCIVDELATDDKSKQVCFAPKIVNRSCSVRPPVLEGILWQVLLANELVAACFELMRKS